MQVFNASETVHMQMFDASDIVHIMQLVDASDMQLCDLSEVSYIMHNLNIGLLWRYNLIRWLLSVSKETYPITN